MKERFVIAGRRPLRGAIALPGAKNAVLPMLAAALLCRGTVRLENCPRLTDVDAMRALLHWLSCPTYWQGETLVVEAGAARLREMPASISREMRSSIFLLGPMLGRFGRAVCGYPGGCKIGARPIDLHLAGLRAMGAVVREEENRVVCPSCRLHGGEIRLSMPSVGATENLMMAAVTAPGMTRILGAAREPEVAALAEMLNAMGARVEGAGSDTVTVEGVPGESLGSCRVRAPGDRIVAGTYLIAAAMTGGEILVEGAESAALGPLPEILERAGCRMNLSRGAVGLTAPARPKAIGRVVTAPYPGFATDLQAPLFALCTVAEGESTIVEQIFERRFHHAQELARMGAQIRLDRNTAVIRGVESLAGARLWAQDLRGGAALVLAALAARGISVVENVHFIDRGYPRLEKSLSQLGAYILRP